MSPFHELWTNPNMSVALESIRAAGSPQSCLVFKATGQGEEKIWVGIISIVALL